MCFLFFLVESSRQPPHQHQQHQWSNPASQTSSPARGPAPSTASAIPTDPAAGEGGDGSAASSAPGSGPTKGAPPTAAPVAIHGGDESPVLSDAAASLPAASDHQLQPPSKVRFAPVGSLGRHCYSSGGGVGGLGKGRGFWCRRRQEGVGKEAVKKRL